MNGDDLRDFLKFPKNAPIISTWPNMGNGRLIRIFITGPDQPDDDAGNEALITYLREAVGEFFDDLDRGVDFDPPENVPGFIPVKE